MGEAYNPGSGHINQALTNLVVKHPTRVRFVADEICNVVPVEKESDKFWKIDDAALVDQSARVTKATGGESNQVELSWQEDSYRCEEKALHAVLPHRTRDNADGGLGLEVETVSLPRDGVLLAKEIAAAAILFSSTYITNTAGATATWDNGTASSIKAWNDLLDAAFKVTKFGGVEATHVAMSGGSWNALAKYLMAQAGSPAGVRWAGVAQILQENPSAIPASIAGLRLLVGTAVKSTAVRGKDVSRAASGGNLSEVITDNALVFHKGTGGLKSVQLAARFMKRGYPQVTQGEYADTRKATWYEYSELESGAKVIAASCGFLITNTLE